MVAHDFVNYVMPTLQAEDASIEEKTKAVLVLPIKGAYILYNVFVKYHVEYSILIYSLLTLLVALSLLFSIWRAQYKKRLEFCIYFLSTYVVKTISYFILNETHHVNGNFHNSITWFLKILQ